MTAKPKKTGRPSSFTEEIAETICTPSIYGLFDHAGNLRYIGKANNPKKRLASHMRDARRRRTPLYDWINKNGFPEMRVLKADCADWKADERRLIAEARARGDRLLNLADGGDEPFCAPEIRAANGHKVAQIRKNNPRAMRVWQLKRTLGSALKSGHLSNTARANMRIAASIDPESFGSWASIPDREENEHGQAV